MKNVAATFMLRIVAAGFNLRCFYLSFPHKKFPKLTNLG